MFYYLHFYLLAFGILKKELYPGFPVVRGAFKLRELVSPQYCLQGKDKKHSRGVSVMSTTGCMIRKCHFNVQLRKHSGPSLKLFYDGF